MKQIPPREANSSSASQISRILCNPKVHYRIYQNSPLVSIPSQIIPVESVSTQLRSTLILSSHLCLGLSSCLHQISPQKNPVCTYTLPHSATCPAPLILLNLINRIIFYDYRSWSSSLCNFLQSPVNFLVPNIFFSTLFSLWQTKFHTNNRQNYSSVYINIHTTKYAFKKCPLLAAHRFTQHPNERAIEVAVF